MTTEEKARAYADKKTEEFVPEHYGSMKKRRFVERFDSYDIGRAYLAGATEALASQWKDLKVELPEDEETVLTLSSYGPVLAYYSKQDEMWFAYGNYGDITPTHWLSIPLLKGGDA